MTRGKVPELGSVFLVPLRDEGYARGVLARTDGRGGAFGYFFGPRIKSVDDVELADLVPDNAILIGMFGDLGFIRGTWPVVSIIENWNESDWPLPPLARVIEDERRAFLSYYDDGLNFVKETEIDVEEADSYPYDRSMGAGAVEIRLTKLLNPTWSSTPDVSQSPPAQESSPGQKKVRFYLYFPDEKDAQRAHRKLERRGFEAIKRLSADDVNWLVLVHATEEADDDSITEENEELMEQIAAKYHGEYDGLEREI